MRDLAAGEATGVTSRTEPPASGPVTARILLPDQSAIRARGLVVRTAAGVAIDDLDLAIERNQCTGIAGHEDAGWRELCEVMTGRRRTHDGDITVLGHDPVREPYIVRSKVGYLPEPFGLPPHLHLDEYLQACAASHGIAKARWPVLVDTLLNLVGLAARHRLLTHGLPPAQRQLLGIAGALVHDPTVLILEDPTAGLDEGDRQGVWSLLERLLDVSRTIVVASTNLGELAAHCESLAVLDAAKLVAFGPPEAVVAELGGARHVRVRLTNGAVRTHTVADVAAQAALLRKLVEAGVEVAEFTEVTAGLDDLHLHGRQP